MILGLKIVVVGGNVPTIGPLLIRNLPFSGFYLLSMIPFVGYLFLAASFLVEIIELVLILTNNNRMGDRMADTIVIESDIPAQANSVP